MSKNVRSVEGAAVYYVMEKSVWMMSASRGGACERGGATEIHNEIQTYRTEEAAYKGADKWQTKENAAVLKSKQLK